MSDLHWSPSGRPRPYVPTAPDDEPSRGFVFGLTLGAVFWLILLGIVVVVTR